MNMNKKQKTVILVGIGIMVVMSLIPPWFHTVQEKGHAKEERSSVYGPIFKPPRPHVYDVIERGLVDKTLDVDTFRTLIDNINWGVRLDTDRLLVQWAMVALVAAAFFLVMADKKPKS